MRSELAIAMLASACRLTDLDQTIGIIPKDLPDEFVANLEEAGRCWNLEFGTKFVSGATAAEQPQQVEVFFDNLACLDAAAEVQGQWPVKLAICPQRYWGGLPNLSGIPNVTPFRVVSHELGHVVNIIVHPSDPQAVMQNGGLEFAPMFAAADHELFADANSNFIAPTSPCSQVIRSYRPGTGGAVSHCACDAGSLDLAVPTAVVAAPQLAAQFPALLAAATRCYNLRYGLQLLTEDPADQHLYIERCYSYPSERATDTDSALACVRQDTTIFDALDAIALALGLRTLSGPTIPFPATLDARLATQYGAAVACANVAVDPVTNECSCTP